MMWYWILLLIVLGIHGWLWSLFPTVTKRNKHVCYDVCIVLGCPTNGDGTISDEQLSRVKLAIDLYQKGFVKNILLTGGNAHNEHVEALVMARYALQQKVKESAIVIEEKAQNTYENMKYSKALCEQYQFQNYLIITSQYHLRRANFFVRKFFDQYAMEGAPTTKSPYLSEYVRMWNTLYHEVKLRKK